jgi:outer membrane lipoprotein SlyB
MKKIVLSIVCLLALTFTAVPAGAQTRSRYINRGTTYNRRYDSNRVYNNQVYRNDVYRGYGRNGSYRDRSVWDQSRDKLTTAAGAGGGALLGAALGGKKGAIIGALVGGGGAALYTYGIRDKHHHRRF